jgi:hypothetical protein
MGIGVSEQVKTSITEHDHGFVPIKPEKLVYLVRLADVPAMGTSGGVSGLH